MPTIKRILYYFAVVLVHAGSAFVTVCCTSLIVPIATSQLKMSSELANLFFGGIMSFVNFVLQIFAGSISDNCTSKFGRRKTFIVPGAIMVCIGMVLMGYCKLFGVMLGDYDGLVYDDNSSESDSFDGDSNNDNSGSETGLEGHYVFHPIGFLFCLVGDIIVSIGNAFYGVCSRTLAIDVIPFEEQQTVQFLNMLMNNLSYCIYYFSAAIMAETELFYYVVFGIGITVVIVSTTITTIFVKEEPYKPFYKASTCSGCKDFGDAFIHMPKKIICLIFLIFGFALSVSPYTLNINNYVGENLYNGSALMNDDQFKKGIKINNYAQGVACIFGCLASIIFPLISKGKEIVYYISGVFVTTLTVVIYVVLNYCDDDIGSASVGVVIGLFLTTIVNQIAGIPPNSIPWAFCKLVSPAHRVGIYIGMMMSVYLLSGIVSSLVSSALLGVYGDLVYVFIYQIVVLILMCGCSFLLIYVNKGNKSESDYEEAIESSTEHRDDEIQDVQGVNTLGNADTNEKDRLLEKDD